MRVELQFPYSSLIISATTYHLLALNGDTNAPDVGGLGNTDFQSTSSGNTTVFLTDTQPNMPYTMYTYIAVTVILVAILIMVIFICVFIMCAMKRKANPKAGARGGLSGQNSQGPGPSRGPGPGKARHVTGSEVSL